MLQGADSDLFNTLVTKSHNSESKSTISFTNKANKIKLKRLPLVSSLRIFIFAPSALMG